MRKIIAKVTQSCHLNQKLFSIIPSMKVCEHIGILCRENGVYIFEINRTFMS